MKRFMLGLLVMGMMLPSVVRADSDCEIYQTDEYRFGCNTKDLNASAEYAIGSVVQTVGAGRCIKSNGEEADWQYNRMIRCTSNGALAIDDKWTTHGPVYCEDSDIKSEDDENAEYCARNPSGEERCVTSWNSFDIDGGASTGWQDGCLRVKCKDNFVPNSGRTGCIPNVVQSADCKESSTVIIGGASSFPDIIISGNAGDLLVGNKILITGRSVHLYCFTQSELDNWDYDSSANHVQNVCKASEHSRIIIKGDGKSVSQFNCSQNGTWQEKPLERCSENQQCNETDPNCKVGVVDTTGNLVNMTTSETNRTFSTDVGMEVCWGYVCKQGFVVQPDGTCKAQAQIDKEKQQAENKQKQQQAAAAAAAANKKKCEASWGKWTGGKCTCEAANMVSRGNECVCKDADYEKDNDSKSCKMKDVAKLKQVCDVAIEAGEKVKWDEAKKECRCDDELSHFKANKCEWDERVKACRAVRNATWVGNLDKGECKCNNPAKVWNGTTCVDAGDDEDDVQTVQISQEEQLKIEITASTKRIESSQKSLDDIISGLKLTVWRDEDGKFNTARLASDSIAGVVLGTTGALVTSSLVKKKQVEDGFEDIQCTIGGQKVADWGDQFRVGIQ